MALFDNVHYKHNTLFPYCFPIIAPKNEKNKLHTLCFVDNYIHNSKKHMLYSCKKKLCFVDIYIHNSKKHMLHSCKKKLCFVDIYIHNSKKHMLHSCKKKLCFVDNYIHNSKKTCRIHAHKNKRT